MAQHGDWDVAVAGECMVTRPFSMHHEPEFTAVASLLRQADVTYAHLEMNLGEFGGVGWPARGDWFGSYMLADPRLAHDLRWLGIDIMSLANNHSLDFGAAGLRSTIAHCRAAGLACAGTGMDLEEAREPAYLETPRGRVALVSASSGNKPYEWAGLPKGGMPGRPGVNQVRVTTRYLVDQAAAGQLREIGRRLGILRQPEDGGPTAGGRLGRDEFRLLMPEDQSTRGAGVFVESDRFGITTRCHPGDLAGNLRSVQEATSMADLVIVAHHFNISEGGRGDRPPRFAEEFAHACIDSGADMYFGHGWHKTLGIEVYKGRPVFYGLGNFFAQSEFIRRVPYDSYETWGHDVDRLPTLTPAAHPLHPGLDTGSETWWSSAVAVLELRGRHLARIRLHPVELGREVTAEAKLTRPTGRDPHPRTEGRPLLADRENGERVLARLQRLSAAYGTAIDIRDGVGILTL